MGLCFGLSVPNLTGPVFIEFLNSYVGPILYPSKACYDLSERVPVNLAVRHLASLALTCADSLLQSRRRCRCRRSQVVFLSTCTPFRVPWASGALSIQPSACASLAGFVLLCGASMWARRVAIASACLIFQLATCILRIGLRLGIACSARSFWFCWLPVLYCTTAAAMPIPMEGFPVNPNPLSSGSLLPSGCGGSTISAEAHASLEISGHADFDSSAASVVSHPIAIAEALGLPNPRLGFGELPLPFDEQARRVMRYPDLSLLCTDFSCLSGLSASASRAVDAGISARDWLDVVESVRYSNGSTSCWAPALFVDGSVFEQQAGAPSGWCVVLGVCFDSDPVSFLPAAFFGGSAVSFASLSKDTGTHLSYSAECAALFWAAAFLLGIGASDPFDIFFDNLSAGQGASEQCSGDIEGGPFGAMRSLFLALQQVCSCRFFHVRSHTAIPGNDIADAGAKAAALGVLDTNPSGACVDLDFWLSGSRLQWLWLFVVNDHKRSDSFPVLDGDVLNWSYPVARPSKPAKQLFGIDAAPAFGEPTPAAKAVDFTCSLRLASYNVLSLLDGLGATRDPPLDLSAGRPEFLRRQLAEAGTHVVALQETRAKESGFWAPSDYFRFIAAGEDGCLGCEIWISKLLPIATSGLGKVVPKLEHFTVLHQDPRALFLRTQCSPLDLTFVCVHAPHSGVEKEVRAQWWQRLSLLWQRFAQGRRVAMVFF